MKRFTGQRIGFAVTGSFCTFSRAFAQAQQLVDDGAALTPIFSEHAAAINTRFGQADQQVKTLEQICGRPAIRTIADAEPLGPKALLDIIIVAPCTANTLGKLAHGIVDTTVTMAVKSMLRNERPVLIAAATNDALRASARSLGILMNTKHYYFVPLAQDDPQKKPASMVADFSRLPDAAEAALHGQQIQPFII